MTSCGCLPSIESLVKERVLQLEDESLRKSFLDEGIGHMFFGPTAAESVDASLSGRALSWARVPPGQHVPPICFCCTFWP